MSVLRLLCAAAASILVVGCAPTRHLQSLDVVGEIRMYNHDLIRSQPSQAAVKFEKMGKTLMSFNRGVNHVFYSYVHLVGLPSTWIGPHTGSVVLHGDFHVENIGAYETSAGNIVVDLQDFDDSMQGPAILDVYRAASSLYLAARSDSWKRELVEVFVNSYAEAMDLIALGDFSLTKSLDENAPYPVVRQLIKKAASWDRASFYSDFARCKVDSGRQVFVYDQGYQKAPEDLVRLLMESYLAHRGAQAIPIDREYYGVQDAVLERGSGVGSAGSLKIRILLRGPSEDTQDDIILEFKEAGPPQGQLFAVRHYGHQGNRVFEGAQFLQTLPPQEMGIASAEGKDFFVKELMLRYRELKWSRLEGRDEMREAATLAGILLAKGHARSSAKSNLVAKEMAELLAGRRDVFLRDVYHFCKGYERMLQEGYEDFSNEIAVSPIL